ncbi:MAG: aminotransferase class I/II-fold pyridoxal phosphate-dependent enzyme [Candidatus Cyclobacteriaceae bacterium M3_2C_046]
MISRKLDANLLVTQWIEYWNKHDALAAFNSFDDDFEFYSSLLENNKAHPDGVIKNKSALKTYFNKIVQDIPELKLTIKEISTRGDTVNVIYQSKSEALTAQASITFSDKGKIKKSHFNFRKNTIFANRIHKIPKSFIREILKVTSQPDVISFAGGLPNPEYFPIEPIQEATLKVLKDGKNVLQYAVSEGYYPLRQFISQRYQQKKGITVDPADIIITNGSQQSLDLAGKIFINPLDKVLLEKPSYLGAIQAFAAYEPSFINADLLHDGIDLIQFEKAIQAHQVRLFYTVPNFQNPTGISYSLEKRQKVAEILQKSQTWLVEDDPYGEIRFIGQDLPPIAKYLPNQSILSGSFSKIIAPGLRMGWIAAPKEVIEKIVMVKQASDLHSNYLSQRVIFQFLQDNDLEQHIDRIRKAYLKQRNLMVEMIEQYFPPEVKVTRPEGGMFLWVTLPEGYDSIQLFESGIYHKVAFVPGKPFFTGSEGKNTFRLNFSNSDPDRIEKGIQKLGAIMKDFLRQQKKLTKKEPV